MVHIEGCGWGHSSHLKHSKVWEQQPFCHLILQYYCHRVRNLSVSPLWISWEKMLTYKVSSNMLLYYIYIYIYVCVCVYVHVCWHVCIPWSRGQFSGIVLIPQCRWSINQCFILRPPVFILPGTVANTLFVWSVLVEPFLKTYFKRRYDLKLHHKLAVNNKYLYVVILLFCRWQCMFHGIMHVSCKSFSIWVHDKIKNSK